MKAQIDVKKFKTTFEYLETLAAAAGTNITEVCRRKKIRRGTIQRWKGADPDSIRILRIMEAGIAEFKNTKSKSKNSKG